MTPQEYAAHVRRVVDAARPFTEADLAALAELIPAPKPKRRRLVPRPSPPVDDDQVRELHARITAIENSGTGPACENGTDHGIPEDKATPGQSSMSVPIVNQVADNGA